MKRGGGETWKIKKICKKGGKNMENQENMPYGPLFLHSVQCYFGPRRKLSKKIIVAFFNLDSINIFY